MGRLIVCLLFVETDERIDEMGSESPANEYESIDIQVRDRNGELIGSDNFNVEVPEEAAVPAVLTLNPKRKF
jgi:hypothetical protein